MAALVELTTRSGMVVVGGIGTAVNTLAGKTRRVADGSGLPARTIGRRGPAVLDPRLTVPVAERVLAAGLALDYAVLTGRTEGRVSPGARGGGAAVVAAELTATRGVRGDLRPATRVARRPEDVSARIVRPTTPRVVVAVLVRAIPRAADVRAIERTGDEHPTPGADNSGARPLVAGARAAKACARCQRR